MPAYFLAIFCKNLFLFLYVLCIIKEFIVCVRSIANKTGSMIAKSLPKVADAGQNLSKGLEKTSSNVDSINCAINKLTTTIDEAKDKFISTKADKNVKSVLGTVSGVASKEEEIRKNVIDKMFQITSDKFNRVKYSFIPREFPSGEKITLKKSLLNQIIDAATENKTLKIDYKNLKGDKIQGVIFKETVRNGETCYPCAFKRINPKGLVESVGVFYYPKSNEIRTVSNTLNGEKILGQITGSEAGGLIKTSGPVQDVFVRSKK